MARVTVEDCLDYVENRFSLVHLAATRTKQLYKGSKPLVSCKNRESVTSLREIAEGKVRPTVPEKTDA
jgi:DNA-directed RNA polymerase subunit omega